MNGLKENPRNFTRREFNTIAGLFSAEALLTLLFGKSSYLPTPTVEIDLPPDSNSTKRLLLLADVHIDNRNNILERQINTLAAARLLTVINQMKDKYFDWVIQMGDLITGAASEKININNFKKGVEIISQLPSNVIHIPGNHEAWGIGLDQLSQTLRECGYSTPLYGVKEISSKYQMVWLDLAAKKNVIGTLPDERIDWLRSVIHSDTPTIIFSHYGFLTPDITGNYYYEKDREAAAFGNGTQAWRYLRDLPIRAVVSAHLHEQTLSVVGHTTMMTVPSFTENIASHTPTNPGVYSILEVTDSQLNIKSYCGKYCLSSLSI